jgi:hypothetical protein
MKILSVAAEMFHAGGQTDRQTDMMKLIVAFDSFANAPKNDTSSAIIVTAALASVNSEYVCPVSIDYRCKYG